MNQQHWMWQQADKAWHAFLSGVGFIGGHHATGKKYNHVVALVTIVIGIAYEFAYKWASHKWDGQVWEINLGLFVFRHEWVAEDEDWWDVVADAIGILMPYSLTW